jgi:ATP-dependent Lon protease
MDNLNRILIKELEVLELGSKIQSQVQSEVGKNQREYFLREQMKAIQKELGEGDDTQREIKELRERIEKAQMPPEVQKEADRELERLKRMPAQAAEHTVARTYIETLCDLPWAVSTDDNLNMIEAEKVLNEDHYDLAMVKERILEFLAVKKLKQSVKGSIICFAGPPGVGKTSLGKSIARAMGRKFVRISLGGMRDEAEIRGHRRTYIGALPGRVIQGLRTAGSNNPVFMLDEIDKLGADFRGDPAAALLEVLDPAQNDSFEDHYLNIPFDLSKVLFVTTANILDSIPRPLLDRMEVIEIPGYITMDKVEIAKKYLLPRQIEENGIPPKLLKISDEAHRHIIRRYTREAGVRELERKYGSISRKVARRIAGGNKRPVHIGERNVTQYLGQEEYRSEIARKTEARRLCHEARVSADKPHVRHSQIGERSNDGHVQTSMSSRSSD